MFNNRIKIIIQVIQTYYQSLCNLQHNISDIIVFHKKKNQDIGYFLNFFVFILIRISLSKNNITVADINRLIHLDNETVSFIITSKELKPTRRSSTSCCYKNGCITDIDDDINKNHAKDLGNSVVMHSHVFDAIQATFLNQSNTHRVPSKAVTFYATCFCIFFHI